MREREVKPLGLHSLEVSFDDVRTRLETRPDYEGVVEGHPVRVIYEKHEGASFEYAAVGCIYPSEESEPSAGQQVARVIFMQSGLGVNRADALKTVLGSRFGPPVIREIEERERQEQQSA